MYQKYTPDGTVVPKERRAEINQKILYVIDTGSSALPNEAIYNCYTGIGGLHGLDFKDFSSYHDFSEAKKEVEYGQFFTVPALARLAVECTSPEPSETVMDACCGMGAFFNFLPTEENCHGFDIDPNAVKVARRLYPKAKLRVLDIRRWSPDGEDKYDIIFQNSPYNLDFGDDIKQTSQMYSLLKSADALKPAGLIAVICPESFLADTFWNRTDIETVEERLSFIGQCHLPEDAFKSEGVEKFSTKLMVWHLRSEVLPHKSYDASFLSDSDLKAAVDAFKATRHQLRLKVLKESIENNPDEKFQYELKKLLYQIKVHPATRDKYSDATGYYDKYVNQKPPEGLNDKEYNIWYKTKRITPNKVLAYCRRILAEQNPKRLHLDYHLVFDRSSIRIVSDDPEKKKRLKEENVNPISVNTAVRLGSDIRYSLPFDLTDKRQARGCVRLLRRRQREYDLQNTAFRDIVPDAGTTAYLDSFSFTNTRGEQCRLTDLQKQDLGKLMSKRYSLINWQQGSGKTAALYAFGKRLLGTGRTRCVFVVAPALAINLTWKPFLTANGENFCVLKSYSDIEKTDVRGRFTLVSLSIINTIRRPLQRLCRTLDEKATLLLDESDELTNPLSARTRATLAVFRRLHHKMLATGTTTRNNIGEMYSQLELLYNNSVNFLCTSPDIYEYDKDGDLCSKPNSYYMQPFPPRGGHRLFKACHCPGKTTVFGISKFNQDVLNSDDLWDICERTVITRQFTEFAGKKYSIFTHGIRQTEAEEAVYSTIFKDLQKIIPLYFSPLADTRKEAALRLVRLLDLLIKACSIPHTMPGYTGTALPTKTGEILRMLEERSDEKVLVGVTSLDALMLYRDTIAERFPLRELFLIDGSVDFKKRQNILKQFEATSNGILVCTQQALKSSVNIPTCNEVICESLQWNIPKVAQFFFRTIRFDSAENTNVHFVLYDNTIEKNIMCLLLAKQRLNDFIKNGEVATEEDTRKEFGIEDGFLEELIGKEYDSEGNVYFTWGGQMIG